MITRTSPHTVDETLQRLIAAVEERSITVFARIDHSDGARKAGLELAGEMVVIFGNPQTGTPLMQEDPRVGLDLPLRMLVWDDAGTTAIGYRDPQDLQRDYALTRTAATLAKMRALLDGLAADAAR